MYLDLSFGHRLVRLTLLGGISPSLVVLQKVGIPTVLLLPKQDTTIAARATRMGAPKGGGVFENQSGTLWFRDPHWPVKTNKFPGGDNRGYTFT